MRQAVALDRICELGIQRIDVDRQLAFLPQIIEDVLVCGNGESGIHLETAREGFQKLPRMLRRVTVISAVLGDEAGVFPDGNPILAPVATECPTRQRLTGIPFPLSKMQQATGSKTLAQPAQQFHRALAFHRPQRGGSPFGSVGVVERNESRLATHGKPHVSGTQIGIHPSPELFDCLPLPVGIWFGDAGRFVNPLYRHFVTEFRLAGFEQAENRCCAACVRSAGERDMPLAGQQPGCGIESNPSGARKIRFGPRVQVREIGGGTGRSFERLHVRHELNQIAGNEAGR